MIVAMLNVQYVMCNIHVATQLSSENNLNDLGDIK